MSYYDWRYEFGDEEEARIAQEIQEQREHDDYLQKAADKALEDEYWEHVERELVEYESYVASD